MFFLSPHFQNCSLSIKFSIITSGTVCHRERSWLVPFHCSSPLFHWWLVVTLSHQHNCVQLNIPPENRFVRELIKSRQGVRHLATSQQCQRRPSGDNSLVPELRFFKKSPLLSSVASLLWWVSLSLVELRTHFVSFKKTIEGETILALYLLLCLQKIHWSVFWVSTGQQWLTLGCTEAKRQ